MTRTSDRAWLWLAFAVVVSHSAVFLLGRTLMPIAPSLSMIPGAPFGYHGPVADITTTLDPAASLNVSFANDVYTAGELARGSIPFWRGHQGFGAPYLASGHPAVLYPLTPLLAIVPRHSYEFVHLLNWYLAALFTYLYLRTIDVGRTGALLGGTAVVCSGFFQYYFSFREASTTAAWFPALLWAVERTIRDPGWRGRHAALAIPIYCTVTAGQPESTALALAGATLYGLASVALVRARLKALLAFVPGVAAGTLITAPYWWTFSDYAFSAYSAHEAGSTTAQVTLGWRTLAAYVMPQLYGRVQTLPPWMVPDGWSWDLSPGWITVAVTTGVLFGVWRAVSERSRPLLLVIALAVLMGGRMWGIPPFTFIGRLPLFDRMVFPRYAAFVVAFAAAILAGAGWDAALSRPARTWMRAGLAWIGVAAVLYVATGIWRQPVFTAIQVRAFSALNVLWIVLVPAALVWLRARRPADDGALRTALAIAAAMILQFVAFMPGYPPETYAVLSVGCLGAWVLLTLLFSLSPARRPIVFVTMAAVVCALPEAVLALSDIRGLPTRYDATAEPPFVHALRALQASTGGRSYALDGAPQPNFGSVARIDQLNTCDPLLTRAAATFMERHLDAGADPIWFSGNTAPRRPVRAIDEFRRNRRFFNLAAVRYLVTRTTQIHPASEDPRMRLAYSDAATGVQIWEDLDAGPRAFLGCPGGRVRFPERALEVLPQLGDLRHEIAIDRDAAIPCLPGSPAPSGTLESFTARGNDVAIRYRADTPGVLATADAYDQGWHVRVDGAPAEVLRVNGVFRGVAIAQAGTHVVEFWYRPPHWRASVGAAAAGVVLLVLAGIAPVRRKGV